MAIDRIDIAQVATTLTKPFHMANLGYVDDFSVSVFICQGKIEWHRHIDEDELFLVHSGIIGLESEWGNTRLRSDEMAVVPKGVAHRSSSVVRSTVLLFQPSVMSDRKNGDRRTTARAHGKSLHKVSVAKAAQKLTEPFQPVDLLTVEDCVMRLVLIQGTFPWHVHRSHDELFLVFEGNMTLDTEQGKVPLTAGEMAIVSQGMLHRPAALARTIALLFEKKALISTGD